MLLDVNYVTAKTRSRKVGGYDATVFHKPIVIFTGNVVATTDKRVS